jgi:hypothetical protein
MTETICRISDAQIMANNKIGDGYDATIGDPSP